MWIEITPPPNVPSLENSNPSMAKRFTSICITHLIMHRQGWLKRKMDELGIDSMQKAIEFVIRNIDYPIVRGVPNDKHTYNAFNGKACYTINLDYWSCASETLMTYILNKKLYNRNGMGDCEDGGILTTAFLRILNIPAYTVFGVVYKNSRLLGGHGWTVAEFPDKTWRLIETTLDIPPEWYNGYPEIDPEDNKWNVGGVTYEGLLKFDEAHYYEWMTKKTKTPKLLYIYLWFTKRNKHMLRKYQELEQAWGIRIKPLKKRGILSRLRWRK